MQKHLAKIATIEARSKHKSTEPKSREYRSAAKKKAENTKVQTADSPQPP